MPATPTPGEGTVFAIKVATVFVEIGRILSINPPGGEVDIVEQTHLGSVAWEGRPCLIVDNGEVEFTIQYDPNDTQHKLLVSRVDTPLATADQFKLTYNDGMVVPANDTFFGFVTKFEPDSVEKGKDIEATVTVKISGTVTRVAGAAS